MPRPSERSLSCRFICYKFESTPTFFYSEYMSCSLNFQDLTTLSILGEQYKLRSSSLYNLLQSLFSLLLGPNICLRILFSNILGLHSSLNAGDHVSQPYNTNDNIIVIYILIFKFLERN